MTLAHDLRRVVSSLEAALVGADTDRIRALRRAWNGAVVSEGNIVWNRVDNPAKRKP